MNDMRKVLENFLNTSTPEMLRAELEKGIRPYLQTLKDPVLVSEGEFLLPASVSFFQGVFAQEQCSMELTTTAGSLQTCLAGSDEMAMAA